MNHPLLLSVFVLVLLLCGCAGQDSLSQEELKKQYQVDSVVSSVLFEHELDESASYHVRNDGFVVIKFADAVPFDIYNKVVSELRANPEVEGLRAEQNGV